jgi:sulfite reductase (NADPH) flavoprotein alpha-component
LDFSVRYLATSLLIFSYLLFCWLCWRHHQRKQESSAALNNIGNESDVDIIVAYASQTGNAIRIAQQSAQQLQQAGKVVELLPLNQLTGKQLLTATHVLIIASTYGEGEAPDNAKRFIPRTLNVLDDQSLQSVEYLILGLGDSSYTHFCGFAQQLHNALHQRGAHALADMISVDKLDDSALRHWQYYLGKLAGTSHFADWSKPTYSDWLLISRNCINPASLGAPAYHLQLQPLAPSANSQSWQAGDIVEIGPCNSLARIEYFLQRIQRNIPIEALLEKDLHLNDSELSSLASMDDEAVIASLAELAHREYSIASVPEEGSLDLLVRQVQLPHEQLGIGSGWLTAHAPLNSVIRLRVRSNPHFHSPPAQHPLILIGNGTGIAGLRSHLANPARAAGKHWLFFGERNECADDFFSADINRWQQTGLLTRVNKVFSRDAAPTGARYVQDLLAPNAAEIREWVAAGAAIFVCGSLQGMAQSVDEVLAAILGAERLEQLADQLRYCRDVY